MRRTELTEAEAAQAADVFVSHRSYIDSVARRFSPHPQDVPDIVQAVGVKICQSLNGFRGQSQIRSWLYRITMNAARDHFRKDRLLHQVIARSDQFNPQSEAVYDPDPVVSGERLAALGEAVRKLRPSHQRAIGEEIAAEDQGHLVLATSSTTRYRARNALRRQIAGDPRIDQ